MVSDIKEINGLLSYSNNIIKKTPTIRASDRDEDARGRAIGRELAETPTNCGEAFAIG
jgi:hypothetical protein